jgi:hypothetical protein
MHSGSIVLLVTESYIKPKSTISIEIVFGFPSCHAIASVCFIVLLGKAVPLEAWSGPEASRKLRFPDFMTTAQDGGKVVNLMHRPPLPPRKHTW